MKLAYGVTLVTFGAALAAFGCGSDSKKMVVPATAGAGNDNKGGAAGAATAGSGGTAGNAGATEAGAGGITSDAGAGGQGGDHAGSAGRGGEAGGAGESKVFDIDFSAETLPSALNVNDGTLTGSQGYAEHGFGATFLRSATGNVVTLTLNDLPPHTLLSLDMLFAAIDSLDGEGVFPAGDYFRITLDGNVIFRESFANAEATQVQSYVPSPGAELARRVDLGFGGPGGYYTDSAYDFSKEPVFHDIAHTASSAVITFTLEGEGVQSLDDESWAIDNLRVSVR